MTEKTRKGKSTHQGHCQACGRLQMLPNGLLSLHGYTVSFGYFRGTCRGSKEQPFEKSCELVKTFIADAKVGLASVEAFQAKLRQPATSPEAFFYTLQANPKGRYYSHSREWAVCTVTEEIVRYGEGPDDFYRKFRRDGDTEWRMNADKSFAVVPDDYELGHDHKSDLLQVCTKSNEAYAKWLEHEADGLRRYIAWQTERVNTWKEADLKPLAGPIKDDKMGFKPTAAAY